MFEACLLQGKVFKMIVESMKDLVVDVNLECSSSGISMQAMDASHVSLCALLLETKGFAQFRCDRKRALGLNLTSLSKVLKCAGNDDSITIKAEDEGDELNIMFENKSQERVSDFQLKLMDIDSENLGIPDTEYSCEIVMSASEFQKICRDLSLLGDAVTIKVTKEGVSFKVEGDIGVGNITLRERASADGGDDDVAITMDEPIELKFALHYLNLFAKAAPLSGTVRLSMSENVPLVVEFHLENLGYIRYFLAPKISDDDEEEAEE
jgi:proliferating cell nuclear antigen